MARFRLDPVTNDIYVDGFSFATVQDEIDEVSQRLTVKLLFFKEEWFLDRNYGIPYFQTIFVKNVDKETVDNIYKQAIITETGVEELVSYSSVFDRINRVFTVTATVRMSSGNTLTLTLAV